MPDKKHKAIRSNKKDAIYDLMTDLGSILYLPYLDANLNAKVNERDGVCRYRSSVKSTYSPSPFSIGFVERDCA